MEQFGNLKIRIILVFAAAALFACGDEKKPVKVKKVEARVKATRPDFNGDSAYYFVQKQVDLGPRVPNTTAHVACGNYLASELARFNFEVTEQRTQVVAFDQTKLNIKNIIGAYKPELNNRVLLFAHWDTRPNADQDEERAEEPILGANDGASGVGVLLEIARQIEAKQPNIGVDIIFFDAEDYADPTSSTEDYCLGSQYWAKNMHKIGYSANFGILLDMVGGKDAVFAKEYNSMVYASAYVHHAWNVADDLNHGKYFLSQTTRHVGVDDHVYVNQIAKIPSIDIIQFDPETRSFAPHWHTHADDMDVIDKSTLTAVGETVLATVLMEAN